MPIVGSPAGGVGATALALAAGGVSGIATYFSGDKLVLTVSGARPVDETRPRPSSSTSSARWPSPPTCRCRPSTSSTTPRRTPSPPAAIRPTRRSRSRRGLLEKLDREELQGVIAHELSHVRNFDIRFSLVVGVMVGAIAILADFFLRFTFWGGWPASSRTGTAAATAQAVILVVAIVLAILAPIISRFIQLAVSRQREYLADASSRRADPQPVRPGTGAGQDRRATRRSSRSPTGGPSTCTSRTRSRSSRHVRRG